MPGTPVIPARLLLWGLLAALLAWPAAAQITPGERPDPSDLKDLSLEDLMEIDVTSVSKRSERLSRAAAAITVITREDLRRSGVTSLPEALRLVNSLEIARQDTRNWAISARGFNLTLANKLLVLIDGRSVYTPLFAGVFWDVQDVLLEDVERIEIIRGPGATLWGANAVNGVINIITRPAGDTQGGLVSGAAGNEERAIVAGRYGGRIGGHGHYRLYAKSSERGALALADGSDPGDPNRLRQGGFRADWKDPGSRDAWTLQGDLYDGVIGELTLQDDQVGGANLLSRWTRTLAGGSDLTVQAYYDRTHRRIPAWFEEHRDTWDLELQHHLQVGRRHNVVWGAGYRTTRDDVVNSLGVGFFPASRSVDLANVFAQDELSFLKDRLRLTVGSKVEHHESTGFEIQPSVRLAWAPDEDQTVWGAISRAVRSPTRLDEDVRFFAGDGQTVTIRGDRDFESEKLTAYELGWRSRLRPDLFVDVATYYHDYDDLRSVERSPGGGLPVVLANKLEGQTYGAEIRTNYDLNPSWRLQGAYAYLGKRLRLDPDSTDPSGGVGEGNDPRHRFLVRSTFDLPHRTELDVWLRHVAELPSPAVPSYTEADLRLGWRATEKLELSLVGRNLLHDQHPEAGPAAAREEVERSVYGKVLWRF